MLLVASAAWAQSRNITGIVFDTDGKSPLVGATVILKGTATGTISNADGTYTIHVGSDNDVLVFQSLGYDPQEVTVGSRTTINVTLKESAQKIDEVVVTALGRPARRNRSAMPFRKSRATNSPNPYRATG